MRRRIFSMILVAVMVFTSVDITAFAQNGNGAEVLTVAEDEFVTEEESENGQEGDSSNLIVEATQTPIQEPTQAPAETPSAEPTPIVTVAPTEVPVATEITIESSEPSPAVPETPAVSADSTPAILVLAEAGEVSNVTEELTSAETVEALSEGEIIDFQVTENTVLTEDTKVTGNLYIKKGYDLFLGGFTLEVSGDAEIYGDIDLDGGSLIIHGNTLHTYGGITFGGGSMTVGGDYYMAELKNDGTYIRGDGFLIMGNVADTLDVDGDFYYSSIKTNDFVLSAGTISFAGDVTLIDKFGCTGTHKMIFDGIGEQRICFDRDNAFANELEIQNDNVIVERLSFVTLTADATVNADDADIWAYEKNVLNLNSHNLTINGDATIRGGIGGINLAGGALTVNGNVTHPSGKIAFNSGRIEIAGDYRVQKRKTDDLGQVSYVKGDGYLEMAGKQDFLDVDGDFYLSSSNAYKNILSAGTISFAGDVTIEDQFKCDGIHQMIFDGTGEQRICFGVNNDQIFANELGIQNDKVIVERLSFAKLLSDATINADDADIWAQNGPLNLNSYSLTVNGDVTLRGGGQGLDLAGGTLKVNGDVIHPSGKIIFNGGSLEVGGDYRIETRETDEQDVEVYTDSRGYLIMINPQDVLDVDGDFITNRSIGSEYELTAGTINLAGNVRIEDRYFRGKNTHRVVFDGTEEQTVYVSQIDNYFNEVEFKNENVIVESIGFNKLVSDAHVTTSDAVIWAGDPVLKSENNCKMTLDGHKLTVNGDITLGIYAYISVDLAGGEFIVNGDFLHTAGDIVFNKGSLKISGDYRAAKKSTDDNNAYEESSTALFMNDVRDYMDVNGDFISDSGHSFNHELNAGIMELAGDVTINDAYFRCAGTHKVILDGDEKQVITIPSIRAYFNILQLTKKMENYEFNPYGCWKKLLQAKEILIKYADTYYYTGQAIEPEVEVYEGKILLEEDKDYTVSYKNNVKANSVTTGKKAPTIIVKGKGGYDGTNTATFKILKRNIADEEIVVDDFTATYNKTVLKKTPVLYHNGKKLVVKTDFTVTYPDLSDEAYKEPGTYTVLVKGKGNYTGTREITFTVTPVKFMKDVKVSTIMSQPYTGGEVNLQTMKNPPAIMYGTTALKEGVHFRADYENNTKVGTATMTLTGTNIETPEGTFTGTKVVTFKISGKSLAKAKVTGIPKAMTYTGQEINEQTEGWGSAIKVTLSGKTLTRAADEDSVGDYVVVFANNITKGTASVTIKGVNDYTGSVKKKFTINAYNINDNKSKNLVTEEITHGIVFAKGGSKPEPVVKFGETVLTKEKDYTLAYKNNTKHHNGISKNKPTVTITGKGNFKGSVKLTFAINMQDIGNMTLTAPDATYKKAKGAYKSALVVKDINGKTLKNGTDFTAIYTYGQDVTTVNKKDSKVGDTVNTTDIVPAGTRIKVTVFGKGSYTSKNPLTAEYMVVKGSVANATVTIPSQKYTGAPVTIEEKNKIKVKIGKTVLKAEDFIIVDGSYENNTNVGTASFIIKGVGNYGGTKKVTFKITKRKFDAWWRIIFQ